MRAIYALGVLACLLVAGLVLVQERARAPTDAGPSVEPPSGAERERERVPDQYVVVYRRDAVTSVRERTDSLERGEGFESELRFGDAIEGFSAELSPRQVEEVEARPDVDYVVPDRRVQAATAEPLVEGEPAPPAGVRRIEAATSTTAHAASGANVAVIDSGIELTHPDLDAQNGVDCAGSGAADDEDGHGTHVAGTIGAENDGAGVVGVAPGTRLYAVRVLGANGSGTMSQVVCGIDWVTGTRTDGDASNDIAVANMSLSTVGASMRSCSTTIDPMHQAICRSTSTGIAYVVAAGNDGWDFDYEPEPSVPAAYPEVLTVTASSDSDGLGGGAGGAPACRPGEADDRYASFSNYAATAPGLEHTVAAPGVCVRSTWPGGAYNTISGTSMATPHVAGAVALCLEEGGTRGPCAGMAPAEIVDRMRSVAESRTKEDPAYGFEGDPERPVTGQAYGYLAWAGSHASAGVASAGVSAAPAAVRIQVGSLRSGDAGDLAQDDGSYHRVDSAAGAGGSPTATWYGAFRDLPASPESLEVGYSGKSSRASDQTLSIYDFAARSWEAIDRRSVGRSETGLADLSPAGGGAEYVSGSGALRVRVRCTRTSGAFVTSGDLLRIAYR